MKSRLTWLGALTVVTCLGLLGCEHWRNGLRKDGEETSTSAKDMDDSVSKWAKSEHAGGTKSGAWSGTAREIESHFNVQ